MVRSVPGGRDFVGEDENFSSETDRRSWVKPEVARLEAEAAEDGFDPNISDGLITKS